jgi:hypothetical protein
LNPTEELRLCELLDKLREILCWEDVVLDDAGFSSSNPTTRVFAPMLYVLAELCRNAYKHGDWHTESRGTSGSSMSPSEKRIKIDFSTKSGRLSRVTVTNPTRKPPSHFDGRNVGLATIRLKGRLLVARVVEDLLGGHFTFEICNGNAEAIVEL